METNLKFIRITGKYEIPQELELGQTFTLHADFDVVRIEQNDNQDGTCNVTYVLKSTGLDAGEDEEKN